VKNKFRFLLIILLLGLPWPSWARTVRVGVYENKPLVFRDRQDGRYQGMCIDVLEEVARREGWQLRYEAGTWSRCLERLENGAIDLLVAIAWSAAREKKFAFSREPLFINWGTIYVPRNSPIKSIVDLKGRSVAVLQNDIHRAVLADLLLRFRLTCRLVDVDGYDQVFRLLENGTVDAGLVNRLYGSVNDRKYAVERTAMILNPVNVCYAAPRGQTALLAAIDRHLTAMKADEGSLYYRSQSHWLAGIPRTEPMPAWAVWLLGVVAAMTVILLVFNLLLKRQVKERTAALQETCKKLAASENRLELVLKGADLGIWDWDLQSGSIVSNERWATILGYDARDVNHSLAEWESLVHADDLPAVRRAIQDHLEGRREHYEAEYRMRSKDGSWIWLLDRGRVVERDAEGRPARMAGTHLDITLRKRAAEERERFAAQMQHTQKLESLGILAGGIAHDFNNILTVILGNVDLARRELAPASTALPRLTAIRQATRRAADLARQMLAYSGKGRFEVLDVDLNELIREMGHLLQVSISKKIELRYRLAAQLPAVVADPSQIRQVVMNLITNASEAIGDRNGIITLTTGVRYCDRDYLRGTFLDEQQPAGEYVFLEAEDNGCGMDRETRERIFDPFFTTKMTGRGLGMAAVLGIVRGHRGAIRVYSEVGRGTSIKIFLPAAPRQPDVPATPSSAAGRWRGQGTVLLVDDEESIRFLGQEMLQLLGFEVLSAADGRQAVELYRRAGRDIVCVILDLTMPNMGGEEAFHFLREMDEQVKVVIASGYSESGIRDQFIGRGLAGVIQKPYLLDDLRTVLQQILG